MSYYVPRYLTTGYQTKLYHQAKGRSDEPQIGQKHALCLIAAFPFPCTALWFVIGWASVFCLAGMICPADRNESFPPHVLALVFPWC